MVRQLGKSVISRFSESPCLKHKVERYWGRHPKLMTTCSHVCVHTTIFIYTWICAHTHAHTCTCWWKVTHLSCEWQNKDLNLDSLTVNPCTELSVGTPTIGILLTSPSGFPWHPVVIQHRRKACGNCVVWRQCSWLQHFSGFSRNHTLAPIPHFYLLPLLQWRQGKPYLWPHHNLLWILSPNIEHSFSPKHKNPSKTIIKFPLLVVL